MINIKKIPYLTITAVEQGIFFSITSFVGFTQYNHILLVLTSWV